MKAKRERYRTGEKALTRTELEKVLAVVDTLEDEVLIKLAVTTGIRREDLAALEWSCIDEGEGKLTFYENKKRRFHTVPLCAEVLQLLRKYRNTLGKSKRKRILPFTGRTAYNRLHALCEKAGIPKRPFHALRATCIKLSQAAGWRPEETARLVDDTIEVIQAHYSTPSESEMRQAAREKSIL